MHEHPLDRWRHEHVYLGASHARNERRVRWVVGLTLAMMVGEIVAGSVFGSMALLADGWHMATHAGALSISAAAYAFARRRAHDPRYAFGTGKVGDLAGFASAVLLAGVACLIGYEGLARLLSPAAIRFDEAIWVAALGLAVNLVSALLLGDDHGDPVEGGAHAHEHAHEHEHEHEHDEHEHDEHEHDEHEHDGQARDEHAHDEHAHDEHAHGEHEHGEHAHAEHEHAEHEHAEHEHAEHELAAEARVQGAPRSHHDHNLRSAYLHVLADALTSVFAIVALCAGKYLGWSFLDPICGVVGAAVILRWSFGLMRETAGVLLDADPDPRIGAAIRRRLERADGDRIVDLHVWRVGPGHFAAIVSLVTHEPRDPEHYKRRLADVERLAHVTVEVQRCPESPPT
ncbi:MAG: CDF family Co(II)/Ni(II) efflux transporter DmeF [Planctomycetes bacterium]|nr:CDF family Co(II)/Ni(II) efflux transporter DmeF [Planctomycetota bacterium]